MTHPKYDGPVIDGHCHYDATTIEHADAVAVRAGLRAAVSFWDTNWPPPGFAAEGVAWGDRAETVVRCVMPDLTDVGTAEFEARSERAIREAARLGAAGVKMWKNLGLWLTDADGHRFGVDDPRLDVIWRTAAELGLPIVIHQGDSPWFFAPLDERNPRRDELRDHPEWWYGGGDHPPLERIHEQLEATVARHPETTFVGLHFGCFMTWPEVDRMLATYPNYRVDTATTIADMGRDDAWEQVRAIIVRHADRVLFGTDLIRTAHQDLPGPDGNWRIEALDPDDPSRWQVDAWFQRHWDFFETGEPRLQHPIPDAGGWTVHGLDLPLAVLRQLYWENAVRTFRLPARLIAPSTPSRPEA
ncbi:amidohydrolase family protein [Patulibacter defluvii]|uniref:amidohydrolase family protein n=1 Tax=Patulibacter defluvii TaxID=3095358 RepID=UPI002A750B56|nr:amidohydrolase family protein [Patulibacter sp. DM4]